MEFGIVRAGHDRNQIYLIAAETERFVSLVNGTTKTFENPKKKNKKHIQVIKKLPQEIEQIMASSEEQNHKVKKAVKCLNQKIYNTQNDRQ